MDIVIPTIEESQEKSKIVDLLDRQGFVERMLTIAETLSDNRKNACYAINGNWGVGKTFVLDMFEEQAKVIGKEGEIEDRYLLFRYNCWEYDFYEEPLVAIVASILDQINKSVDLLPDELKTKIVAILKVIGKGLVKKAVQLVEERAGINLEKVVETIKEGGEAAEKKIRESHEYDRYFDFKEHLKSLRETVTSLAEKQTVIFVVDELDRCLPKYTIKVLERLHHLFEGIPNVQVILTIDLGQLEHIVRQIYGEQVDATSYLRKFIQFELRLEAGTINDGFDERFANYTQHFKLQSATTNEQDVIEFRRCIFDGINMRSRISIINKCELIHKFLAKDEVVDSGYMCLEILLVLLNDCEIDISRAEQRFSISSVFNPAIFNRTIPNGLCLLSDKYKSNQVSDTSSQNYYQSVYNSFMEKQISYVNAGCLFGKLLCAYRAILGFEKDEYQYAHDQREFLEFIKTGKQCWSFLQSIK